MASADVVAMLVYLILFLPLIFPNFVLFSLFCFFNHFLALYAHYRRDAVRPRLQARAAREAHGHVRPPPDGPSLRGYPAKLPT
ncbi:uncharacterized protein B0T15DRAFT_528540 [Chaetomium strumarium]|uniref:Uncharacterized protein n=1 Tax=Chaetomium strumarium TaxID=1170767 RepID=A0AAJ0M2S8_9PEZI|nr:hypothetical protein B0T15DRAFT_528540 [Chaetomium strumarium]